MHRGTLCMRIGPMFSGKTTWLNYELTQLADKGFTVLKIIHADDNRDDVACNDHCGSTHNSSYTSLTKKIHCVRADKLSEVDVSEYNVVGIDESQFFGDLVTYVELWVEIYGKHLRVVGLDGDADKKKFGSTLDIIPMCDEVIKKNASCYICLQHLKASGFCGNIHAIVGSFTKRLRSSVELSIDDLSKRVVPIEDMQKDVGGSDKYIPVCRYHHSIE